MKTPTQEWQALILYKLLLKKNTAAGAASRHTLNNCLPAVCEILRAGSTSPIDFSLHDERHSHRVAVRMSEIIPSDVLSKLSEYELSLLILSAYLHDIGMTPTKGKVSSHYRYLLTGDPTLLNEELSEFRHWLGDYAADVSIPLGAVPLTAAAVSKAEQLTALYCRFKHNDWSEQWIRENLNQISWEGYSSWIPDLILLCKSHHLGYTELIKPHFDPKLVASNRTSIVNLRYLACVLRVADILEFDPERTPEVLFRHRAISHDSVIYWHKDHAIQRAVNLSKRQVFISAQPNSAKLHKAILQMIDSIDAELLLCRRLAEEVHFDKFPGLTIGVCHRWDLPSLTHRQIKPQENTYVYIDGAFRPDTEKLLQLLSGAQLYGSSWAGIREMLQNAFDAVKESIAYEWLAGSTTDPLRLNALASLHEVGIHFESNNGESTLACKDSGVGMSKSIIENHMLVSGSARRSDLTELERRCTEKGFSLSRTGQFGIGVLSYFMLADRVTITTRRSGLCDDAEGNGWTFETEGVGSFGELRTQNTHRQGTTIQLHLAQNICEVPTVFYARLKKYIQETLIFAPCILRISSNLGPEVTEYRSGWARSVNSLTDLVLDNLDGIVGDRDYVRRELLPVSRQHELKEADALWRTIKGELRAHIAWHTETGQLEGGLGQYRIHIPVFQTQGGMSLAFVRDRLKNELLPIGRGYCFAPAAKVFHSWKGMYLNRTPFRLQFRRGIVEFDWTNPAAGTISIARSEYVPTEAAIVASEIVKAKASALLVKIAEENKESSFSSINYRLAEIPDQSPRGPAWIKKGTLSAAWKKIQFPAISRLAYAYDDRPPSPILFNGAKVEVIQCLPQPDDKKSYEGLSWNSSLSCPDKIVMSPKTDFDLTALWTEAPTSDGLCAIGPVAAFPRIWNHCVGVYFDSYSETSESATVWNKDHPLAKSVNAETMAWARDHFRQDEDPLGFKRILIDKPAYGAAWVAVSLEQREEDYWNGVRDRDKPFLEQLWELLSLKRKMRSLIFGDNRSYDTFVYSISPDGWFKISPGSVLKEPGPRWRIE
jgi:hypothetical protein